MAAAIAAREATGRNVLVCSEETHSSAEKAARMIGMQTRKVACDEYGRMLPGELGDLSDAAIVVATVGTTSRGAVDPVAEIAAHTRPAGAWLHIDAAYAGTAMVCPEFRWAFDGIEHADSLVVNAHKWMLTPIDCSMLWTSRREAFREAFSLVPEYLRTPSVEDAWSLNEYGPALGRRFRALKLWAVLRCYGRDGLQQHVRDGVRMAADFESWISDDPDWEVVSPRHFGLVCFRHHGDDAFNRALLERVNESGELFISHTVINGSYALRLAAGGLLTTADDMRYTWGVMRREAAALAGAATAATGA
jgi:aromatic-L-amino-acid decarboxylase